MAAKKKNRTRGDWRDWIEARLVSALVWIALRLPIERRLRLVSWVVRRVIGPLAGWIPRTYANLDYVWPDLPEARKKEIAQRVLDNLARAWIENYDPQEMLARGAAGDIEGPGWPLIEQAAKDGQPVVLVTGHFGAAVVARAALLARGYDVGIVVRAMSNPYANDHYMENMVALSDKTFVQGRRGTLALIKHVRSGGMAVLLFDLYSGSGELIDFLGKPAPTMTSAAEIALRTDALLIPYFGIRHDDGYAFTAVFEAPIAHTTPTEMMQEATRRLEARIIADPGQWLWSHRRWKPERQAKRQRKREAAKMAP